MHCNIQAEIGQDMFKGVDKLLHFKIPVHRVRYVYLHCLRAEWGQLLFGCLIHCFISILCLHAVQTSSWFPLEPSLGENSFRAVNYWPLMAPSPAVFVVSIESNRSLVSASIVQTSPSLLRQESAAAVLPGPVLTISDLFPPFSICLHKKAWFMKVITLISTASEKD